MKKFLAISTCVLSVAAFALDYSGTWRGSGSQEVHVTGDLVDCTEAVLSVDQSSTSLKVSTNDFSCGGEASPARTVEFGVDGSALTLQGTVVGTISDSGIQATLPVPDTDLVAKIRIDRQGDSELTYTRELFKAGTHVSTTTIDLDLD